MEIRLHGFNLTNADIDNITAELTDPSGNVATGLTATLIEANPPRGRYVAGTSTIDEVGPWTLQFTINVTGGAVFKSTQEVFDGVNG